VIECEGRGLVFLLSTPRAGSTLLGAILGNHPEVLCPPEPWFLLPLLGIRDQRVVGIAPYGYGLAQRGFADLIDEPLFLDAVKAFALTACNTLLARHGKRVFVDKDCRYYHIVKTLRRIFPEAVYIWLYRSPLDVIASHKSTWGLSPHQIFRSPAGVAAFDLILGFHYLNDELSGDQRTIMVRYEDLVTDPEATVSNACAMASIRFDAQMLDIYRNDDLMEAYRSSERGDKKIHRETSIHRRSIGLWRTSLTPDEVRVSLEAIGTSPFTRLGYEDDLDVALELAGVDPSALSQDGRRSVVQQELAAYPPSAASLAAAAEGRPTTPRIRSETLMLERAFRALLEEKEAELQLQAQAAAARQVLLEEAEAAHAELRRVLEEKEAELRLQAREAASRQAPLEAAVSAGHAPSACPSTRTG
jgi:hypothetical protein